MEEPLIVNYRVTLQTPRGVFDVDLKSTQGPEAAARRAQWTLIHSRYGDVDEVVVLGTAVVCGWFAGCERLATGWTKHPVLGRVPTCEEHGA